MIYNIRAEIDGVNHIMCADGKPINFTDMLTAKRVAKAEKYAGKCDSYQIFIPKDKKIVLTDRQVEGLDPI